MKNRIKKIWGWEYFDYIATWAIFIFSMVSIFLTVSLDKQSDKLNNIELDIIDTYTYGNRFVAKNDDINLFGKLVELRILPDEPHLPRQAFIYGRQAIGYGDHDKQQTKEAEKRISGVYDYISNIPLEDVINKNALHVDELYKEKTKLENSRSFLLSLIRIIQYFIVIIAFTTGVRQVKATARNISKE